MNAKLTSGIWPKVSVAEIAAPNCKAIVSGPFGSNIGRRFFVDDGVPVIRGNNLTLGQKKFVDDGFVFITEEKAYELRNCEALPGDIVFTAAGTLGQVGLIPKHSRFARYIISNKQLRVRFDPVRTKPDYLYYWFSAPAMREHIANQNRGSSVPLITLGTLRALEVTLPPLVIQRRIAAILSAYDDLIENNMRRIAILEEMARRIYEEWFVRFRFPGHEQTRMVESEVGPVPEGWEVVKLGRLAEINARSVRRGMEPDEIRYVDISSVSTGSIDKKETMPFADAPGRARRIVRDGDVIWACVRPNRKSYALVLDPEPNLLVSTGFAVLTAVAAPWSFVYQCVTTDDFVSHLVNRAKGAAYPAVGAEDFEHARVVLPTANHLHDFDRMTAPMMRLVAALQKKNRNLRTTRDLLLPRLISGELDVSDLPEPQAAIA